jgi:2-oxoglutarate ferredoxin oxidoreductase subunit beta
MATANDYASDQDVRWCPGCGDYSILKQFLTVLAQLGADPDRTVVVSGIGCSSRLPYYVNTYGVHSIHGRAPALVTGLRMTRPDLDVWVVTGDGDALSIGGNHLIHLLRRNVKAPILLFNNEIYGLTKGQYSPTSGVGQRTKSSPLGVVDAPFVPTALALGAGGTFIARSIDRDPEHLRTVLHRAHAHNGSAFVEIYQNCNVFHDGAFDAFSNKDEKAHHFLPVVHGEPLVFGPNQSLGMVLDGLQPKIVDLTAGHSVSDCWVHDETDLVKAQILASLHGSVRPFGVLYAVERPVFEVSMKEQAPAASLSLDEMLAGGRTCEVL